MRRTLTLAVATATATILPLAGATTAEASPEPAAPRVTHAKGLLTPLSAAVARSGATYVSQNFAGLLMRKKPGGKMKVVHSAEGGAEVGALSVRKRVVTFAVTRELPDGDVRTKLKHWSKANGVSTFANLSRFEAEHNPDGGTTYGFRDLDESCEDQLPAEFEPYTGIIESHPYATATTSDVTFVADAAANAIFAVTPEGVVSTHAVLPGIPLEITAEMAEASGMPACVVGHEFWFEPVPTDVEIGPDGWLYVTTLPGGPEDPSLGARATVEKVHPVSGHVNRIAAGLVSATGLAVAETGDIYVAELFADRISKIPDGSSTPEKWRKVILPGAVEFGVPETALYVTTKVLTGLSGQPDDPPQGKLVSFLL